MTTVEMPWEQGINRSCKGTQEKMTQKPKTLPHLQERKALLCQVTSDRIKKKSKPIRYAHY